MKTIEKDKNQSEKSIVIIHKIYSSINSRHAYRQNIYVFKSFCFIINREVIYSMRDVNISLRTSKVYY